MQPMNPRTVTRTVRRRTAKDGRKPHLFVVLRCDQPLEPGSRICLDAVDTVVLGRGETQRAERSTAYIHCGCRFHMKWLTRPLV